jgi:hypothetical protein
MYGPFERSHDIRSLVGLPDVNRRSQTCEGVDHRQDTDFATIEELIMDKVHGHTSWGQSRSFDLHEALPEPAA